MEDRRAAVELLSGRFAERAAELGLEGEATVAYRPRSDASTPEELIAELDESLAADLERGFTMHGPHRDELVLKLDARELRRYGSQGQQRLGLLALLLAERDALAANRDALPLLLLDDVLSELDAPRRQALLASLEQDGQTLITTADPQAASPGLRLRSISLDPAGGVLREEEAPA
jgi:DNA replication and repair protein RecF